MSQPFIIWSFQRTGGTSLSGALSANRDEKCVKHEPFNRDREYGHIAKAISGNELARGTSLLDHELDSGICIKHCFELHSNKFNKLLIDRANKNSNYRHVILMRKSEVERAFSLYLAKQTVVWGKWKVDRGGYEDFREGRKQLEPFPIKEMLEHSRFCLNYKDWLLKEMNQRHIRFFKLNFEDVYRGSKNDRMIKVKDLFDYVGVEFDKTNNAILKRIFENSQGSNQLFQYIPIFDQAMDAFKSQYETN